MTEKKAQKSTDTQTKANSVEKYMEGTEAGKIWNEIKDKEVDVFSLPNQTIAQHAVPAIVEPSKLYLLTRFSSALTAIEAACGKKFNVDLLDKYVVVSRKEVPLTQK